MSGYCDTCGLRPVAGVTIVRMGRTALYVHHCTDCDPDERDTRSSGRRADAPLAYPSSCTDEDTQAAA